MGEAEKRAAAGVAICGAAPFPEVVEHELVTAAALVAARVKPHGLIALPPTPAFPEHRDRSANPSVSYPRHRTD